MISANPVLFVCLQSWVPLRVSASSASEMVTALLFGERCESLQQEGEWLKVRCLHDGYIGWIPLNYLYPLPAGWLHWNWSIVVDADSAWVSDNSQQLGFSQPGNSVILLTPGSWVPAVEQLRIGDTSFRYARKSSADSWRQLSKTALQPNQPIGLRIQETARLFLNTPYVWGGRSIWGVDCSGLVQVVAAMVGIKMPRDANQQVKMGSKKLWAAAEPGDLAYFSNKDGKVTHVGILLENSYIIHAHGRVRIDKITPAGIESIETGKITHTLCDIRTFI